MEDRCLKKKLLIIGGSGFIGSNLCKYLPRDAYDIYSFDIYIPDKRVDSITYIKGDFFDDWTLSNVVQGKDYIIHSLSTLNPGNSNDKYMQGYQKDFIQTIRLCEMIIKEKKKMLFISSGGTVYGDTELQPISENFLPNPISHYGNLKLCIENTICTFMRQTNANMIIARISNTYGPGQDSAKGVGFIDAALKRATSGNPIEIWGDGNNIRDYIYIEDVCKAIDVLLNHEGEDRIFNVGSGKGASQNDIVHIIESMGLKCEVIYKEARGVDVKSIILDNSRMMQLCNIQITDLEKGIDKYYQWIKTKGEKGERNA